MILELKPVGRGNWSVLTMQLSGDRAQPFLFHVGGEILLAGIPFRICKVTSDGQAPNPNLRRPPERPA